MARFALRRLLLIPPLVAFLGFVVYGLVLLVPGDPAIALAGEDATPEQVETIREDLGLNDPLVVQYGRWLADAFRLDLGTSLFSSEDVSTVLARRLPATLALATLAITIGAVVGTLIGTASAYFRGGFVDRLATMTATLGIALPNYWLGLLLLLALAVWVPLFPSQGYSPISEGIGQWLLHLALPAVTLAAAPTAQVSRHVRANLSKNLNSEYVKTARAKGLNEGAVVFKHGGKNALGAVVTVVGLQYIQLLGGTVVVESVFNVAGVGQLLLRAVLLRDLPVIQGVLLLGVVVAVVVNLLVDVGHGYSNPQVRARQLGLI